MTESFENMSYCEECDAVHSMDKKCYRESSKESTEDLPTAAIVNIDAESGYPFADITDYGYHLRKGDELVRRKDVKALIQEAVEHELEKARDSLLVVTDKGGGTDRYRERLQEGLTYRIENLDVEELLEELEQ